MVARNEEQTITRQLITIFDDKGIEANVRVQCVDGAIHLTIENPKASESACCQLGITLEITEGEAVTRIWSDLSSFDPTHDIPLKFDRGKRQEPEMVERGKSNPVLRVSKNR